MRAALSRRLEALETRTERQLWEAAIYAGIPAEYHGLVRERLASIPWDGPLPMANLTTKAVFACPWAYGCAFYHQMEMRLSVPGFVEMMERGPAENCRRWFTETLRAAAEQPVDEEAVMRRIKQALPGSGELLMGRMVKAYRAEQEQGLCD